MPLVNNKEARQINLGGLVLLAPGINSVPDDLWKEALKHDNAKLLVDAGTLEVVRRAEDGAAINTATDPGGLPGAPVDDINQLEPADAIRVIGLTYDRTLLSTWGGSAKNRDVKAALEQQLQAVGLTPEEAEATVKRKK
jgi:hypothetical protein